MKQDGTAGFAGDLPGSRLLPFVLSAIAGSVDAIGFLGLGGPSIGPITGNLVGARSEVRRRQKMQLRRICYRCRYSLCSRATLWLVRLVATVIAGDFRKRHLA